MSDYTLTSAAPQSAAIDHAGGAATVHIYGEFDSGFVQIEGSTDGGTTYTPLTTERGFAAVYKTPQIFNIEFAAMKLRLTGTRLGPAASVKIDIATL